MILKFTYAMKQDLVKFSCTLNQLTNECKGRNDEPTVLLRMQLPLKLTGSCCLLTCKSYNWNKAIALNLMLFIRSFFTITKGEAEL